MKVEERDLPGVSGGVGISAIDCLSDAAIEESTAFAILAKSFGVFPAE